VEGGKKQTKLTTQSDEELCRICWGADGEDENGQKLEEGDINPLISPCKCNGTMGQIHLKCLRGWLSTKRTKKEHKKQMIFKFKKLDCELCKVNFPFKITYNNQIVDIVEIEKPHKNFIVLESLSNESQKIFYVINTEDMKATPQGKIKSAKPAQLNQQIRIGRGADSDVRVNDDISVSR
jgi:hypothetical protein